MVRGIAVTLGALSFAANLAACAQTPPPRIMLFIADGAGAGHWAAARLATDELAVDDFAAVGLVDTRGSNHIVTGSAAAATAYAIGKRSFRGATGVGPDSQPYPTVLEVAERRGMSTGLITTTVVGDATLAAFASHSTRRSALVAARQYGASGADVIMGGGRELFTFLPPDSQPDILTGMRETHTYVTTEAELDALDLARVDQVLGLFAPRDMALAPDRSPSLAALTDAALQILSRNSNGFFLLVENEETDTQAHNHQPLEVIKREMVAFDEAIRVGIEYQRRFPETLVVVTGDHETGGMSITMDSTGAVQAAYHTTYHSAELVPLFARGPGAEEFAGMLTNAQVGQILLGRVRN